ncbi:MAG: hypothetical protein GX202_02630 [Firmicutes bacterium]|nr:hypothetical protein [Bacillota bacterium]
MRKVFFVGLLVIGLLFIPQVTLGLTSPEVKARGGETTVMFIGDKGLQLDTEYGINSEVGLNVAIRKDMAKVGAKYEFDSNLALLLGVVDQAPFFGANLAMPLAQDMGFIGDLTIALASNRLMATLEMGVVIDLGNNLDLRGGLLAETNQSGKNFSFQIGLGVNY